jgi:hypothetical protein
VRNQGQTQRDCQERLCSLQRFNGRQEKRSQGVKQLSSDNAQKNQDLVIFINGKEYQPLKKIANKKDLLELAELDLTSSEIFLLDNDGKRVNIRSEKGLELQSGMRFVTVASKTNIGAGTHKSLA